MNREMIIEAVNRFFFSVDEGNWEEVSRIFNDDVFLDYSSMSGGEPAVRSSQQIIGDWKKLLPGFDHTQHQLSNFLVTKNIENLFRVQCYVIAAHHLQNESGNNLWTVYGSYDIEMNEEKGRFRILKFKFNLKFTQGNNDLPRLATERVRRLGI